MDLERQITSSFRLISLSDASRTASLTDEYNKMDIEIIANSTRIKSLRLETRKRRRRSLKKSRTIEFNEPTEKAMIAKRSLIASLCCYRRTLKKAYENLNKTHITNETLTSIDKQLKRILQARQELHKMKVAGVEEELEWEIGLLDSKYRALYNNHYQLLRKEQLRLKKRCLDEMKERKDLEIHVCSNEIFVSRNSLGH